MKAITPLLAAAAALLTASTTSAQDQQGPITQCDADGTANCLLQNRVCYKYEADDGGTQECGYCTLDYIEIEDECYAIAEVGTDGFLLLARLLELYLPDYVDQDISTAERALRLAGAAKIISSWNSQVPPPPFRLGLTNETFLTEEERSGRLGIAPEITFDDAADGARGQMERLESLGGSLGFFDKEDDSDAVVEDEDENENRRKKRRLAGHHESRKLEDLPPPLAAVDWHAAGYTTAVKQQAMCGCCWAVSVAAAVESALMITNQTNRLDSDERKNLSFQQMISCDTKELGCNGGNILQATKYVWEHDDFGNGNFGGLVSAADWPYTDYFGKTTDTCQFEGKGPKEFTPAAYLNYPKLVNSVNDRSKFDERRDRMIQAVSIQPAQTVMRSGCDLFMNYRDGILTHDSGCECGSTSCIDHAVVVVGYDTAANPPYWKVRNSWGPGWGEEGHFRVAMNDRGVGEWGLFGIMAENAVPSQAYTNLEDLPERPGWWETSATWEKVLVILFSILGFCCLCSCLGALWKKRQN